MIYSETALQPERGTNYGRANKKSAQIFLFSFYLLLLLAPRNGVNVLRLRLVTPIMLQQKRKKILLSYTGLG